MDTDTILSGYNVAKNVLGNKLSGTDSLNFQKSTLETYSLNVYVPQQGRNTSAQGYYQSSLDDIKKAFNIILGKEKGDMVKTFNFSVNETYEKYVPGKGKRTGQSGALLPNFVGKTISEVETFCNTNNIDLKIEYVNSDSEHYNANVAVGLVADQSVHKDVLLSTVKELTIYIINSSVKNNSDTDSKKSDNVEQKDDSTKSKNKDEEIIKSLLD